MLQVMSHNCFVHDHSGWGMCPVCYPNSQIETTATNNSSWHLFPPQGWECPKCHSVYAPWMPECEKCK